MSKLVKTSSLKSDSQSHQIAKSNIYDLESRIQETNQSRLSLCVPTLMPDEFFEGYLGRISLVNGLTVRTDINRILAKWIKQQHPDKTLKVIPAAYCLSKLLNIDVEKFIRQHTLAPITSALKSKLNLNKTDKCEQQNLHGMLIITSKKIKKSACFCASCVDEDLDYHGFSFWRRSHQLSGIDWCIKHNTPLLEAKEDMPYTTQPAFYLFNKRFAEVNIEKYLFHPIIQRYSQLIQEVIDLNEPLDYKVVYQVLLSQSKEFNIRTRVTGDRKTLSDLIIEKLPSSWLKRHFPNLRIDQSGYQYSFDDVLRPNNVCKSCMNTLLAVAVLFENADEALLKLTRHQYKYKTILKPEVSDQDIRNAYIKYQGNISKIASELNINYAIMLNMTSKLGLHALSNLDQPTLKAIISFYNGQDLSSIFKNPDINLDKFQSVIRTAGNFFSSTCKKFKPSILPTVKNKTITL